MAKKNIKNIKLLPIEKRYCRCLMKVRSKKIKNPYAICTNSVYNLQGKKRTKVVNCSKNYNFNKFTIKQLRSYAKSKKIKYSKLRKAELISKIQKYNRNKYK